MRPSKTGRGNLNSERPARVARHSVRKSSGSPESFTDRHVLGVRHCTSLQALRLLPRASVSRSPPPGSFSDHSPKTYVHLSSVRTAIQYVGRRGKPSSTINYHATHCTQNADTPVSLSQADTPGLVKRPLRRLSTRRQEGRRHAYATVARQNLNPVTDRRLCQR